MKVLDFGLAKLIEPASGEGDATRTAATETRDGGDPGHRGLHGARAGRGQAESTSGPTSSASAWCSTRCWPGSSRSGATRCRGRSPPSCATSRRRLTPRAFRLRSARSSSARSRRTRRRGMHPAGNWRPRSRPIRVRWRARRTPNTRWLVAGAAAAVVVAAGLGGWHLYKTEPGRLGAPPGPAGDRPAAGGRQGTGGVRSGTEGRGAHPGRPRISADLGGSGARAAGEDRSGGGRDTTSANWAPMRSPGATWEPHRSRCRCRVATSCGRR